MNATMGDAQTTGNLMRENNLSSVEITHTTRGDTWTIKVYNEDPYKATAIAQTIDKELREKYGTK